MKNISAKDHSVVNIGKGSKITQKSLKKITYIPKIKKISLIIGIIIGIVTSIIGSAIWFLLIKNLIN